MFLRYFDKERAAQDARYQADAMPAVANPLDVDGAEIDVFVAMARAMLRVPRIHLSGVFQASEDALEMIRRQGRRGPNPVHPVEGFQDGEPPRFRGIPIEVE